MKNVVLTSILVLGTASGAWAQSAFDLYQLSQREMRGTARYMSMAGAFGALGGDMSAINLNPGGIGVYRSSDVGITFDFNIGQSKTESIQPDMTSATENNRFKFYCNNAGYVGAARLNSEVMPNVNWGFTYNRAASYNRHYSGTVSDIGSSLSNYIAGVTYDNGRTTDDLTFRNNFDPYLDGSAGWTEILAYNSYITNTVDANNDFQGLFGNETSGSAYFETFESGGIDEFTFNFGGNLANMLYWGLSLGVNSLEYKVDTYYGEMLDNAYVAINHEDEMTGEEYTLIHSGGTADYDIHTYNRTYGTGVNFKLGLIFRPINELRLGFAFHTPTYYSLTNEYYADTQYSYRADGISNQGTAYTNEGYLAEFSYRLHTPWRFVASAAAVLGRSAIVSFDYEYVGFQTMRASDDYYGEFTDLTQDVKDYYRASHIFKLGAEYRLTNELSVRAGYSYQTSASTKAIRDDMLTAYTTMLPSSYETEEETQHITFGLGYRYKKFYTDLALVYRERKGTYHAFSPTFYDNGDIELAPTAKLNNTDTQIVWTLGLRF